MTEPFAEVGAVLFDLDGTLLNTSGGERRANWLVAERFARLLADRGLPVNMDYLFAAVEGLVREMEVHREYDRDRWWRELAGRFGTSLPQEAVASLTEEYWRAYECGSVPYDDAFRTLRYLRKAGYRLGLVPDTDGAKGVKRRRIAKAGLTPFFDVIVVAGEDAGGVRPDPTACLEAARRLGLEPRRCAFVGDKPFTDVEGAKAAGMKAILVHRKGWRFASAADAVVGSLFEVREYLKGVRAR